MTSAKVTILESWQTFRPILALFWLEVIADGDQYFGWKWWWPIFWLQLIVSNITMNDWNRIRIPDKHHFADFVPKYSSISLAWQISHMREPFKSLFVESTFLILLMIPKTYIPSNLSRTKFKKWCYFDGDGDEARKVYRIVFRVLQIHASSSPYFSTLVKLPFSYKASLNLMWSKWGGGKSKTDLVLSKNFYLCWRLMFITSKKICL